VIGWTPIVISALLVPLGPPRVEPIEVAAVDASAYPSVVVEIVAPVRHTAEPITAPMVAVDGSAVESVTPIDPNDVVIGLVIDDRPELPPAAVTQLQGAAVELVRNSTDGVQVSLGTPSGLRTALTPDRDASIARIAGITAGSPAVVELPDVLIDTAAELASSPAQDRHAVVVLGASAVADDAQLAELSTALTESGTTLHVVAPPPVEPGVLDRIARASGGDVSTSAEVLASVDAVTARISDRYRVVATVAEPGRHRVRVSVGGERFAGTFEVPDRAAGSLPSTTARPAAAEPVEPNAPVATVAERTESESPLDLARPSDGGGLPVRPILYVVLAIAAVALVWAGIAVVRRRGDADDEVLVKAPADKAKQPPRAPAEKAKQPPRAPADKAKQPPRAPAEKAQQPPRAPPAPVPERHPPARTPPEPASRVVRAAWTVKRSEAPAPRRASRATGGGAVRPIAGTASPDWLVAGDLRLSRESGEVWCRERKVELTPSELDVLALLMTAGDQGVTRAEIVEAGRLDESSRPDAVDAIVATIRRKAGIRQGAHAVVRKERAVTYFLEGAGTEPSA
jgi:hypothetical protein